MGMVLAVNPETLDTKVITTLSVDFSQYVLNKFWCYSLFYQSLLKHTASPHPLQNDGLSKADMPRKGTFLTVDLCPSQRPLEKRLFEGLIDLWKERRDAAPVTLAITGAWAARHEEELQWLMKKIQEHNLRVNWMNHSFHHPYDRSQPLDKNFLLTPGTDFEQEVLDNEVFPLFLSAAWPGSPRGRSRRREASSSSTETAMNPKEWICCLNYSRTTGGMRLPVVHGSYAP